jgi:hypothetical protein
VPRARAPRTANAFVRVEDDERPSLLLQVVAHREARLAAADHDGVEPLGRRFGERDRVTLVVGCLLYRHDFPPRVE